MHYNMYVPNLTILDFYRSSKGAKSLYFLTTVSLLVVSFYLSYSHNLSYA